MNSYFDFSILNRLQTDEVIKPEEINLDTTPPVEELKEEESLELFVDFKRNENDEDRKEEKDGQYIFGDPFAIDAVAIQMEEEE